MKVKRQKANWWPQERKHAIKEGLAGDATLLTGWPLLPKQEDATFERQTLTIAKMEELNPGAPTATQDHHQPWKKRA